MNPQSISQEIEQKTWFARIKDSLFGAEEPDEDVREPVVSSPLGTHSGGRRQAVPLRIQTARTGRVAVRQNAQSFDDAKLAADGLKSGEYQIVNLEKATPQDKERIVDFLNGVCYALDGTVEKVGEKVYMFVPANVAVEIDPGATATASKPRSTFGE